MKIRFDFSHWKGRTKLWWFYMIIGTFGSFAVAMWFKDTTDPMVEFVAMILWFILLMIGITGIHSEDKKDEDRTSD